MGDHGITASMNHQGNEKKYVAGASVFGVLRVGCEVTTYKASRGSCSRSRVTLSRQHCKLGYIEMLCTLCIAVSVTGELKPI